MTVLLLLLAHVSPRRHEAWCKPVEVHVQLRGRQNPLCLGLHGVTHSVHQTLEKDADRYKSTVVYRY
jgi:hypothetical protein